MNGKVVATCIRDNVHKTLPYNIHDGNWWEMHIGWRGDYAPSGFHGEMRKLRIYHFDMDE